MNGFTRMKKCICAIVFCVLLIMSGVQGAFAIDKIDETRVTSLTVEFDPGDVAAEGAGFRIYHVAEMTDFGTFTLTDEFAKYPLVVNDLDSDGWRVLANTLAGYVTADGIEPLQSGTIDAEGKVSFTGMSVGLYLVTGDAYVGKTQVFTPQPNLIALPNRDADDQWIYDVEISVKHDSIDRILTDISVIKIWNDHDYENRPTEVTVQLIGNGALVEEIVLNRDCNWRHTWEDLDGEVLWQVVENPVPEGYTVKIEQQKTIISITNSREPDNPGGGGGGKLPQTGVLWWPVPVLAVAGMGLFVIGWMRRRANEK